MNRDVDTRLALLRIITTSLALLVSMPGALIAQEAFYTFTSGPGGDGFIWDGDDPPFGLNDLASGETFLAPTTDGLGQINIENFSENTTFFDSNYQAAGNSTVINGDAWWGNPLDESFTTVGASFFNTPNGTANSVAFDFAWAIAGDDAPTVLEVEANDSDGDFALLLIELDNPFDAGPAFGNFTGWEGHVAFETLDFQDDNLDFDNIESFFVSVAEIATLGGTGEFAIDNLSIDGGAGNEGSNVFPSFNSGMNGSGTTFVRNVLKNTGVTSITQAVTNDGADATTFSTEIVPGGGLSDPGQVSGDPINPGQTVFVSPLATLDSSVPSGAYESDFRFINDTNPADADDTLTHRIRVHDPPDLSDDSGSIVQVDVDPQISLANAAAGPHAGALRAGVEVVTRTITGPFTATAGSELINEALVGPGDMRTATLQFNRYGRLNGVYNGSVTVQLEMVSETGSFLLEAAPVPDVEWDLQFNHTTTATDSAAVSSSDPIGPGLVGVNDAVTAATILDGTSSSAQTVGMALASNPEQGDATQSAAHATGTVDLDFTVGADLYVLQLTYDDANLPSGFTEEQMQLLVYDSVAEDWTLAVDENSDGGAGATFFAGSYIDFLAGPGGESLDTADLSSYGVDAANNMAWAVLDHASLFSLGVLGTFSASDVDLDDDGDVDGADFLALQRTNPGLIPDWVSQYGNAPLTAAADAVPEPASSGLLLAGTALELSLSRRRR